MAYRILYVEDNFQNKRLVRKILTARGYEVLEADDGLTGVEIATKELPDLILMDISLPGIDGVEATQRIKAFDGTATDSDHCADGERDARRPRTVYRGGL